MEANAPDSVVAIHGLGAHPDDAWCKTIESPLGKSGKKIWLVDEDMLPRFVPRARMMRYGYESYTCEKHAMHHNMTTLAQRFLAALKRERRVSLTLRFRIFWLILHQGRSYSANDSDSPLFWRLGHFEGCHPLSSFRRQEPTDLIGTLGCS